MGSKAIHFVVSPLAPYTVWHFRGLNDPKHGKDLKSLRETSTS